MRPRALKTIVFGLLAAATAPLFANLPYAHPNSYFESRADLSEPEPVRIQRHLAQVETDLRTHPPRGLSAEQAEARERRLDDLHAYRVRGEFPRNPDYPDSLVPYFIDARGVACAVGQLVIASGHRDFAEEIARTRNHAYIREIDDPRLAAWAEASGLTLEECARIQPSYENAGYYPYIQEIKVGPQGAVWALAAAPCNCSLSLQTFRYDPGGSWTMVFPDQGGLSTLCLDPKGRTLIGWDGKYGKRGLMWNGVMISSAGDAGVNDCEWSPDGATAWVAGNSGLRSYRLSGSALGSMIQTPPTDSMLVLAVGGAFVWSASAQGAFGGLVEGSAAMNKLDSAGPSYLQITGLAAQGRDVLWAGLNGNFGKSPMTLASDPGSAPVFSRNGLRFRHGIAGGWTVYDRAASGLPSDTILALAPADSPSVWIATATGIFKFTPPNTVSRVHIGFAMPVTDLKTDSLGRLYIATWGTGVYRMENGETVSLGYYDPTPIRPAGRDTRDGGIPRWELTPEPRSASRTLLGRKVGPAHAEGIFISREASR